MSTSVDAPSDVLEAARQGRPALRPLWVARAGEEGPRVYWIAFVTSGFLEAQARADAEGTREAFDRDLAAAMDTCEESADVGDCDSCISDCWRSVPSAIGDTTQHLHLVRASVRDSPRVDGSEAIWTGRQRDEIRSRLRRVEDVDGDGRLELALQVVVRNEWPAGDGEDSSRTQLFVDADTLKLQVALRREYEHDGHGGRLQERSEVGFRDRDGDGRRDFSVHFVRENHENECMSYEDDARPPECRNLDVNLTASYSIEHDRWELPEGSAWPWE
ncbi:MAG: hypothetical protein AAGE52_16865 [Myxococcota bacterium]